MKAFFKGIFSNMDEERIMTKRELFLTVTTCTLAGILLGILFSPKKKTMIGSHNGCYNGTYPGEDKEDADTDNFWEDEDDECLSFR